MKKDQAVAALATLGYEIDWTVTGPSEGYWSGTIDAMGRGQIDGDCRGEVVHGDNAADWYRNAIAAARSYQRPTICDNQHCEFHGSDWREIGDEWGDAFKSFDPDRERYGSA